MDCLVHFSVHEKQCTWLQGVATRSEKSVRQMGQSVLGREALSTVFSPVARKSLLLGRADMISVRTGVGVLLDEGGCGQIPLPVRVYAAYVRGYELVLLLLRKGSLVFLYLWTRGGAPHAE